MRRNKEIFLSLQAKPFCNYGLGNGGNLVFWCFKATENRSTKRCLYLLLE